MGIDCYVRWKGQTKEEVEAQYTGWSIVCGHLGYLREAYHGSPYATRVLVPEGFDADEEGVQLSAAVLRERLPEALTAALVRDLLIYRKGKGPGCIGVDDGSELHRMLAGLVGRSKAARTQPRSWTDDVPEVALSIAACQLALWGACGWLPPHAQSYADFVELVERLEAEGKEPRIVVSA